MLRLLKRIWGLFTLLDLYCHVVSSAGLCVLMFVQFGCCGSDQGPIGSVWSVYCHVIVVEDAFPVGIPYLFFFNADDFFFCAPNCSLFVLLVFSLDQHSGELFGSSTLMSLLSGLADELSTRSLFTV